MPEHLRAQLPHLPTEALVRVWLNAEADDYGNILSDERALLPRKLGRVYRELESIHSPDPAGEVRAYKQLGKTVPAVRQVLRGRVPRTGYPQVIPTVARLLTLGKKPVELAGPGVTRAEAHAWLQATGGNIPFAEWVAQQLPGDLYFSPPDVDEPSLGSKHLPVIRWLTRQAEKGTEAKFVKERVLYGPAGETTPYTWSDWLPRLVPEDLVRGVNTRPEDAFAAMLAREKAENDKRMQQQYEAVAAVPSWARGVKGVRALVTPAALAREGREQDHCVGGYVEAVREGRSVILALKLDGERSTAEVSPDATTVFQHRGMNNATPSPALEALLADVLRRGKQARREAKKNSKHQDVPWWEKVTGRVLCVRPRRAPRRLRSEAQRSRRA